jgi:hypothetical protein
VHKGVGIRTDAANGGFQFQKVAVFKIVRAKVNEKKDDEKVYKWYMDHLIKLQLAVTQPSNTDKEIYKTTTF